MIINRDAQIINVSQTTDIINDTNLIDDNSLDIDLLKKYYQEYSMNKPQYIKMKDYYDGIHDIDYNYTKINERANFKSKRNYIAKFVDNETSYTLGNPINYISISNDNKLVDEIEYDLTHWDKKHEINLGNCFGIYRAAYELYYIDKNTQEFNSLLLNPSEAFLITDEYNVPIVFMREYSKKFENKKYIDLYTPSTIYYLDGDFNEIAPRQPNIFGEIPLGFDSIDKTVYDKIKSCQDEYNICNSDSINLLSDLRFFYLIINGIDPTDEKNKTMIQNINQNSIMFLNGEAKVDKLEKNINDSFIQHVRDNIKQDLYELAGHLNLQESPTSNTSGEQLITRLQDLTFRCSLLSASIQNIIRQRIRFLFKYKNIKDGIVRDWKDIKIKITPNIPKSWTIMANVISQLSKAETLSKETMISLLPLDHSPAVELAKIKKEQEEQEIMNLDNIPDDIKSNDGTETVVD